MFGFRNFQRRRVSVLLQCHVDWGRGGVPDGRFGRKKQGVCQGATQLWLRRMSAHDAWSFWCVLGVVLVGPPAGAPLLPHGRKPGCLVVKKKTPRHIAALASQMVVCFYFSVGRTSHVKLRRGKTRGRTKQKTCEITHRHRDPRRRRGRPADQANRRLQLFERAEDGGVELARRLVVDDV